MAQKLGLTTDVAVAAGIIDAHVLFPQSDEVGQMLAIMGTSTCHMLLGTEESKSGYVRCCCRWYFADFTVMKQVRHVSATILRGLLIIVFCVIMKMLKSRNEYS